MPFSAQALYFHLGMDADDDGFAQPKMFMRSVGFTDDDLKVLLAKRFLLPFEGGVVVIKHWLVHNMIRKDRYKPTRFKNEKSSLYLKENNAYTDNENKGEPLLATKWQPNSNRLAPQVRLGKVSKDTANADFFEDEEETRVAVDDEGNEISTSKWGRSRKKDPLNKKYEDMCKWAERRRGFPFISRPKQYAAFRKARENNISITRLKERWIELEAEEWRDGFDWASVVSSFDKRA